MTDRPTPRAALPILFGAAVMLTLSMGIRQSFGLFMRPLIGDLALTVSDFTLALAIQNLTWGLLQPVAGALAAQHGFRPIMLSGAVLYVAGLATLAAARGMAGVVLGPGLMIGASLACTASAMALAVSARVVHLIPATCSRHRDLVGAAQDAQASSFATDGAAAHHASVCLPIT